MYNQSTRDYHTHVIMWVKFKIQYKYHIQQN